MTSKQRVFLQTAALVLVGAFAGKADIVYNVDRTVGTGTITGTITTDGAIGVLAATDIVSYDLELAAAPNFLNLNGTTGVQVVGSDLTATAATLNFDFSGGAGFFLIQPGPEDGFHYYCDQTISGPCLDGETVAADSFEDGGLNGTIAGDVVIGTAHTSAAPEPTFMMLTGLGLAGLTFAAYRRGGVTQAR
jgi:hypothetical protein